MRTRSLFLGFCSLTIAVFAACVGEDATPNSTSTPADVGTGPNSDGSSSSSVDASSGTDATSSTGDDAGTDAAPPFNVASMGGLRPWLESSKNLTTDPGTGFVAWRDSSGHWDAGGVGAPDGGAHAARPHDVNPPSVVKNGFGGRPTVSFIAGNGYLHIDNHADFEFGLGDFVIVEVAKVTSGSGPLWRLAPQATAGTEELFTPGQLCVAYGLGVNNGCTTPVFTPSTEPHVFAARRKSDIFTVRVDGSVRGTLDRTADPPDIGVNQFTQPYVFIGNNVTMQVSEVIVIVGLTSDTALEGLEGHLKTKYAIP